MIPRCFWLLHSWEAFKHGPDLSPYPDWDGRECRHCHRIEVVVYGEWRHLGGYEIERRRAQQPEIGR